MVQKIVAEEKAIGVWLNPTHIVLCVMLLFALLGGVYLFESKRADVAEAKAEAALVAAGGAFNAGGGSPTAAAANAVAQPFGPPVRRGKQLQATNQCGF